MVALSKKFVPSYYMQCRKVQRVSGHKAPFPSSALDATPLRGNHKETLCFLKGSLSGNNVLAAKGRQQQPLEQSSECKHLSDPRDSHGD